MAIATGIYQSVSLVKDDKLDVNQIEKYNLYVSIGDASLQLSVIDTSNNRCLLTEEYSYSPTASSKEVCEVLDGVFEKHSVVKAGFWKKVRVIVKNNYFTFVPSSLFDKTNSEKYLQLNADVDTSAYEILAYKHLGTDATNVFACDKGLVEWFQKTYPKKETEFIHQASALVEGVLRYNKDNKTDGLFLNVDKSSFTAVVTKGGKLQFCNTFNFKSPEDFIYFVMFVSQELKLDISNMKTIVWGELVENSPLFRALEKYVSNNSFGTRPKYLSFGYYFDELLDHKHFALYSAHLCE